MKILVVDDQPETAETLALLLTMYGHDVQTAGNGPAALRAAQAKQPDALLTDIGLPGMDGWQVAKRIRGVCQKKPLVVAITAYGDAASRKRSQDDGFDYHLVKPVDPSRVLELLAQFEGQTAAQLNL